MPKYDQDIVEVRKIINHNPIDTLWVYWETDIYYNIVGSSSQIKIRTHDKIISGSGAELLTDGSSVPLSVGTYSIGTYLNPYNNTIMADYKLVVATSGYISEVYNGIELMDDFGQLRIPNESEYYLEWITTDKNVRPLYIDNRYVTGASYSVLELRTQLPEDFSFYYITDDFGNILTDDYGNKLVWK